MAIPINIEDDTPPPSPSNRGGNFSMSFYIAFNSFDFTLLVRVVSSTNSPFIWLGYGLHWVSQGLHRTISHTFQDNPLRIDEEAQDPERDPLLDNGADSDSSTDDDIGGRPARINVGDDPECLICTELITGQNRSCFVPCGCAHWCQDCAQILLAREDRCPTCRSPIQRIFSARV